MAQARPKIRNDRAYHCTAISAGVPGAARASEQAAAAGTCINGSDDEGDGLIDGYNPAAAEDGTGAVNSCGNGIDDNNDGVADQFDPDCQTDLDCVGTKLAAPLNLPPDWNGDGIISPVAMALDIDREDARTALEPRDEGLDTANRWGVSQPAQ